MKFPYKILDLTYILDPSIPTWSGTCGFHQETMLDYEDCTDPYKFRVQQLKMNAGIGTHIDAPAHCDPNGLTVDQLPLQDLISPCVVIDVSDAVHERYSVSLEDIQVFEKLHGKIPPQTFAIIRTGWDQFWETPDRYHNNHIFPSVSLEAAEFFLSRGISGLGIDTLSPDRPEDGYPVHKLLLGDGKYIIENVANSGLLPVTGAYVMALPIKIKGGTEAPIRLIALEVKEETNGL